MVLFHAHLLTGLSTVRSAVRGNLGYANKAALLLLARCHAKAEKLLLSNQVAQPFLHPNTLCHMDIPLFLKAL